jgi:hypothetical protein
METDLIKRAAAMERLQKTTQMNDNYTHWWKIEGPLDANGNRKSYPAVQGRYEDAVVWAITRPGFTDFNNDGTVTELISSDALLLTTAISSSYALTAIVTGEIPIDIKLLQVRDWNR